MIESIYEWCPLRENTIPVFMTDNGGTAGVRVWNAGLRDGKTSFYDGGHRVPCWFRWPAGNLGSPRDIATPTQVQDIAPTLLEPCAIQKSSSARFDGSSLAALLRGSGRLHDRKFVVQYSRAKLEKWESAVVWNQWRLVHGQELYDVVADRAQHVRAAAGGPRGGHWNVQVERAGDCEVRVLRWPPEVNTAHTASYDAAGKALPIAGARLSIAGQQLVAPAAAGASAITIRATLPAGPTRLQAWFVDNDDNDLCGAFYAVVRRL